MAIDLDVGRLIEPLGGRSWEPAETRRQVALRLTAYRAQGFNPGDRALFLFENRLEFFADLLAVWQLGGCAIPIDPKLTPYEIGRLAELAGARHCIVDEDTRPERVAAIPDANVMQIPRCEGGSSGSGPAGIYPRLDDDALVIFTAGSTGQPKGAVHTLRSIFSRILTLRQLIGTADFSRSLCFLPNHSIPLISNCLFPWLSGCDLYLAPPFQPRVLMSLGEMVDTHGITYLGSVPSMWKLVLKSAKPPRGNSLVRIHSASSPLPKDTWEDAQRWSGTRTVVTCYGSTETASWSVGVLGREVVPEADFIGVPWGCELKVLKMNGGTPEGNAGECAPGESGMVWLRSAGLMRGYLRQPELTDAVVQQGWYMTGDVGYLDERGQLYVHGRARDEINRGGVKVFPAEVEHVAKQFPLTSDACAFRVPDDLYGESIAMAIVLSDNRPAAIGQLFRWMESRLARHKIPARWYLVESLPRLERGKINRDSVMNLCALREPLDLRAALRDAG